MLYHSSEDRRVRGILTSGKAFWTHGAHKGGIPFLFLRQVSCSDNCTYFSIILLTWLEFRVSCQPALWSSGIVVVEADQVKRGNLTHDYPTYNTLVRPDHE